MRYTLDVTYQVRKELIVEVAKGLNPEDPANWGEIESEKETDYYLYDVYSAEEYTD